MNAWQWVNVIVVFAGLTITANDSGNSGNDVLKGTCFIIVGSAMHGLTYVLSEAVMTIGEEKLTVVQNNFVQCLVAASFFFIMAVTIHLTPF
jgi:drug/metabolite transporter (DMT)-like permease